jgi:long-chain fatty acid transport protein
MLVGAFKYNEQWSFAVGADNDDSTMEKYKKLSQYEQPDGDLKIKMKDSAWGFRLATMYKVNEKHQFGLMYRSPIRHEYEGRTYLNDLTDSGLGGPTYNTIFGGSSYETRVSTKFVLPQSIVLGYSFKPDAKWVINADLEWLDWSGVKEQSFDFPDEAPGAKLNVLNTGNPQNRDWTSVWSASLGAEYAVVPKLRLRGGYIFHQTPIGNDTFDTAFNDANSHSLTTGFGYDLSSRLTLDMAYAAVFFESRDINNSVDSVFGADLDGKYTTFVNVGTVTLTYKF